MTLENQVCALEYSQKLKELGVKQESYFYWIEEEDGTFGIYGIGNSDPKTYWAVEYWSAFTVAELLGMLQEVKKTDIVIASDNNKVANSLAAELVEFYEKESKI